MAGSENLSEIVYEEVYVSAQKMGVSQVISANVARMVEEAVKQRCGGERHYVPVPSSDERDTEFFKDYVNGGTIEFLMGKYKMSRSGVYKRIKNI